MDAKTKKSIHLALTLFLLGISIIASYMWIFNQEAKGECNEEVQEVSEERDTILSEFADLENEFDSISAEAYKSGIEIDELTSLRDSLRHELAMAIEQNRDDEKTIKGIRQEMAALQNRYLAIEDSVNVLKAKIKEQEGIITTQGTTIEGQQTIIDTQGEIITIAADELAKEKLENEELREENERAQMLQIQSAGLRFLNKNGKEITGFKATKYVQVSFEVSGNAMRPKGNVTYYIVLKNAQRNPIKYVGSIRCCGGKTFYYSTRETEYFNGVKQTITVTIPYEALQGEKLYAEILISEDNQSFITGRYKAP
ncbi:MAG: hypothetical protein CMN34_02460 [Saprospirales bacterium]|nr:hypothetical protein [Saprospirales bacterium]